jgi:holo-[acyl-carrier protein] synthase
LAARFAAKEACLKSLGLGLGMGLALREIEIINDRSGRPQLTIDRDLSPILKKHRMLAFHLSMTHSHEYAAATVICELER